jgi:hypothetical protein
MLGKFVDFILVVGFFVVLFYSLIQNLPLVHKMLNFIIK